MSLLSDITASFYSSEFYAHVAYVRRGIGMKFIIAFTIIATLLLTGFLIFYSGALHAMAEKMPEFAVDLPAVTIKDGKFSMDKASPYSIPLGSGTDRVWLRADVNYKVGDDKTLQAYMDSNKIIMLATTESYVVTKPDKTVEIHPWSELKSDVTISHDEWMKFAGLVAEKGVQFLIIGSFIFTLVALFLYNLVATFFAGLFVMVLSLATGSPLELDAGMRLAAAFRMPVYAVILAPLMLGAGHITGALAWVIWAAYLIFAVSSAKRAKV